MTLLQEYRESNGLSKRALCKTLDVSDAAVLSWEKGKAMPNEKMLMKIAELIGVDPQTLADDFAANRQTKPDEGAEDCTSSAGLPKITHRRYLNAANMAMEKLRSITDESKSVRLAAEFLVTEIENILFLRQN